MRWILGALSLVLASQSAAAVPVAPVSEAVNARATEELRAAFSSPEALREATLATKSVLIGPRLWAASLPARRVFTKETKDTYCFVPQRDIVTRWGLTPLDLAALPEKMRSVAAVMARLGTPVLTGAVFAHIGQVLPAIVLSQVEKTEFPFAIRRPTDRELDYYYSLIPYELKDPILVVESSKHAFLCHFDEGELFFLEML